MEAGRLSEDGEDVRCDCGMRAPVRTSWTVGNPGQRFVGCERYSSGFKCKYFQWLDPETCAYGKRLVPGLYKKMKSNVRRLDEEKSNVLQEMEDMDAKCVQFHKELDGLRKWNGVLVKMLVCSLFVISILVCKQ